MTNNQKATKFWNWFFANNHKYLFLNEVDDEEKDRLMEDLLKKLHQYSKHLFFEIGAHPKGDLLELIITAEGRIKYFPKVEELVNAAPELKDWRFVKFRQPHGEKFTLEYNNKSFDPTSIIYIPLYSSEDPSSVGIRVCYPDFDEEEKNIFMNGTYIMLDNILGEKSSVLDIDHIEVVKTPEGISEDDYELLSDIGKYIKERKYYKYPGQNFDVIEAQDSSGNLVLTTANFAYQNFFYKKNFPWFLRLTMVFTEVYSSGQPLDEEAEVLNSLEDFIETEIKEVCILHYISRTTCDGKRDIFYYLDDIQKATLRLQLLTSNPDPIRPFSYHIEFDENWRNVEPILNTKRSENIT